MIEPSGQFHERRILAVVWPEIEDLCIAIPSDHPAMALPIPLQATTATANLALAASIFFETLPHETAQPAVAKIERLIFERIATDQQHYVVGSILKLEMERGAWIQYTQESSMDVLSNLDTIIRVVHGTRVESYQNGFRKGMAEWIGNGAPASGYGPIGYVAKQWLSEISGRPIIRPDDLLEDGFSDMGLTCFYFAKVWTRLNELIVT